MKLVNVTNAWVVIADTTRHYATLRPGEAAALPDAMRDDDTVSSLIAQGHLKELKAGQKPPAPPIPKKASTAVSQIKQSEVVVDGKGVSAVKEGEGDGADLGKIPGVDAESGGEMLTRTKGGKTKPTKIVNVSPKKIEDKKGKNKTQIIKTTSKAKSVALDQGGGGVIVNKSGLPGQGTLKSMESLNDADIEAIRTETSTKMTKAARDKKQLMLVRDYQDWDAAKRQQFMANVNDKSLLQTMLKLEKSPGIQMKIRARIKKLGNATE